MHVMNKMGYGHKYCAEFERLVRAELASAGVTDLASVNWVFNSMKDRIVVGENRYGTPNAMYDREQIETIGRDWHNGYLFFDINPYEFLRGARKKRDAIVKTINGTLVPDICNYLMFWYMTANCERHNQDVPPVYQAAAWIFFLVAGRAGMVRGYHETEVDQTVHGKEISGSADFKPTARI